jgi:hypothetical protein
MAFPHFPPLPSDEYMYFATIAVHYAICERESEGGKFIHTDVSKSRNGNSMTILLFSFHSHQNFFSTILLKYMKH